MSGLLYQGVNRGGTITTGGVSQAVAPINRARRGLTFQNTSDTDMWLTETGIVAAVGTGFKLTAGSSADVNTNQAVNVFCITTGKTFGATEY